MKHKLYYMVESPNWSIKWDGIYITKSINNLKLDLSAKMNIHYPQTSNSIIHFGSRNIYLPTAYELVDKSNKIIFTWFHGTDEDTDYINALPEASKYASFVHTSCEISKKQLIRWGVDESKIVVIPIGVDLSIFKKYSDQKKQKLKKWYGIPETSTVIGSFQKDGNGWDEGNDPKMIKGPDIFCDVIEQLSKKHKLFILLSAPARGYVKTRLEKIGIPYKHINLNNYKKIPMLYNMIDLCLVTSRAEGGPKAILESLATGVPLVSTKVGMALDVIIHEKNGFLVEVEDVNGITKYADMLIENQSLRSNFIQNGFETVKNYDYKIIAKRYYDELYKPLMGN